MAKHPINSPSEVRAVENTRGNNLLEADITRALEAAPRFAIPADFAARVASHAAARVVANSDALPVVLPRNVSLPAQRYSRGAAIGSLVALLALIFAFAPRATANSPLWLSAEVVLCVQFAFLAVWLVTRNLRQYLFWPSES